MHESEKWKWSCSVVSDSQQHHGLQPTRLLRPLDFPGKSTGMGCHCLFHNGHVFEQTLKDREGQGSLTCYSRKESDTTEQLNNNNNKVKIPSCSFPINSYLLKNLYQYKLVSLVLELYINRLQTIFIFHIYIFFSMFLRFIFVVIHSSGSSFFFFLSLSNIPLYEYTTIDPFIGRHLAYFQFGAAINKFLGIFQCKYFWWIYNFIFRNI